MRKTKVLSEPRPVYDEDVLELSSVPAKSGAVGREKRRRGTPSPSSSGKIGRRAEFLLAASLALLPGFIPEIAVADSNLYISGGGGAASNSSVVGACKDDQTLEGGGSGGPYAGKGIGNGNSDSSDCGGGGGGGYVGTGNGETAKDGKGAVGGAGYVDDAIKGDGVTAEASSGTGNRGNNSQDPDASNGGSASFASNGDIDDFTHIYITAGQGGPGWGQVHPNLGIGGDASLEADGTVTVETLKITSGEEGGTLDYRWEKGHGGKASLTAGKLIAETITLTKNNGPLLVDVGTLEVSEDTTLTLDNTTAGTKENNAVVYFGTIDFAGGKTLTVNVDEINSGAYGFSTLNVSGEETNHYKGSDLAASWKRLNFDVEDFENDAVLLQVEENADISGSTINVTNFDNDEYTYTLIKSDQTLTASSYTLLVDGNSSEWDLETFMGVSASVHDNQLDVLKGLVWNATEHAHGTFHVEESDYPDGYTLNVDLGDNQDVVSEGDKGEGHDGAYDSGDSTNPRKWSWDGKSLTKTGAGTLVLTQANTYSGGTTISAGTLKITGTLDSDGESNNGYSYAGAISIGGSGGTLSFAQEVNQTLSGVISGDGSLAKSGGGVLTLTETNTYTGGTTINGGTLRGNLPSGRDLTITSGTYDGSTDGSTTTATARTLGALNGAGTIVHTAGLTVTGGGTFAGTIGDTNTTLTVNGSGKTLTLTGTNSYSGGTTLAEGTITVGNASALGTGEVTMADETTLTFAGSYTLENDFTLESGAARFDTDNYQVTLNGSVGGDGGLTKTGEGTLILMGDNEYEGVTTILGGILSIGADEDDGEGNIKHFLGTLGIDNDKANLLSGGTLKITGTGNYDQNWFLATPDPGKTNIIEVYSDQVMATFRDAVLSGDGGFTKAGGGTLILNASGNEVGGAVEVNAGSLIVGGSGSQTAEGKYQASDASLTATSVTVENGALLGGHGTIAGEVFIGAGGILSPGNSPGTLKVTGNVVFKGESHFAVDIDLENLNGDLLDITGTATLGGAVYHVADPNDTVADYFSSEKKEWLILSARKLDGAFAEEVVSDLPGLAPQLRYADEKDADGNEGSDGVNDTLYLLFFRKESGEGEAHASLKGILLTREDAFLRRLRRHVSELSIPGKASDSSNGGGFWIGVNKSTAKLDGNGQSARATWSGTELFGGHDAKLSDGKLAGFAFRLEEGRQEVDAWRSEAEIISGTAALHGGKELPAGPGALRVLLAGAITRHDIESKRHVQKTHYHGKTLSASIETAYRVSSPNETLSAEPYAALTHHRQSLDGFTEKGGTAALKKKKESETQTRSTLGLRLSTSPKARVTFDVDVGWQHLFGSPTPKSTFTFREGGNSRFTTPGAPVNKNAALLGLSVGAKITKNSNLRLQYQGELGSQGQSHEGQLVLEVKW